MTATIGTTDVILACILSVLFTFGAQRVINFAERETRRRRVRETIGAINETVSTLGEFAVNFASAVQRIGMIASPPQRPSADSRSETTNNFHAIDSDAVEAFGRVAKDIIGHAAEIDDRKTKRNDVNDVICDLVGDPKIAAALAAAIAPTAANDGTATPTTVGDAAVIGCAE